MSGRRCRVLLLAALMLAPAARAGEILTCFSRGELGSCTRPALQHVPFKSVVLQFVDPARSGVGESVSRLLWREILESISDLSGAGVILAHDRQGDIERALGEGDLGEFLQREYHRAADTIGRQQNVQMSIWGAALADGDEIFVQPFLTLRQPPSDDWTTLRLEMERPTRFELGAMIGRKRLNLAPIRKTREEFFGGDYTTRCALAGGCPAGVALHAGPSNAAEIVDQVAVGERVRSVDMQGAWMRVDSAQAGERWLNIYHVEMFPREVEYAARTAVNMRAAPGGAVQGKVDLDGRYAVLGARRHGAYAEPWYQIEVNGTPGWVAGRLVNRRSYTLPVVHLIAGLYRYGRGQYDQAVQELESFLERSPQESNVTRSAVYQFLAASQLAGRWTEPTKMAAAITALQRSETLTPFDANVYTLRSVVLAGSGQYLHEAVADLRHALQLNAQNPQARALFRSFYSLSQSHRLDMLAPGYDLRGAETSLQGLVREYGSMQ